MSIWKNGERLGVMVSEGLTSPLCWATSVANHTNSARIGPLSSPRRRENNFEWYMRGGGGGGGCLRPALSDSVQNAAACEGESEKLKA